MEKLKFSRKHKSRVKYLVYVIKSSFVLVSSLQDLGEVLSFTRRVVLAFVEDQGPVSVELLLDLFDLHVRRKLGGELNQCKSTRRVVLDGLELLGPLGVDLSQILVLLLLLLEEVRDVGRRLHLAGEVGAGGSTLLSVASASHLDHSAERELGFKVEDENDCVVCEVAVPATSVDLLDQEDAMLASLGELVKSQSFIIVVNAGEADLVIL